MELKPFEEIYFHAKSKEAALHAYAQERAEAFHFNRALDLAQDGQIFEATWNAYRTDKSSIRPLGFFLILFGLFSASSKTKVIKFKTYHAVSSSLGSATGKLVLGSFIEAIGLLLGLVAISLLIVSGGFLITKFSETWVFWGPLFLIGLFVAISAYVVIRHSKIIRISDPLAQDSTSPFYLSHIRKISHSAATTQNG